VALHQSINTLSLATHKPLSLPLVGIKNKEEKARRRRTRAATRNKEAPITRVGDSPSLSL